MKAVETFPLLYIVVDGEGVGRERGGKERAGGGVDQRSVEVWSLGIASVLPGTLVHIFKAVPDALWKGKKGLVV